MLRGVPLGLITVFPSQYALQIGPLNIGWYGLGYVVAVGVMLLVSQRETVLRGIDPRHITNALIVVAVLALIGARLYHVIDQWGACGPGQLCYSQNLTAIVLPPYSGLGLYGGIAGAMVGIFIYVRRNRLPFWLALDIVVPGTLFAQGIARWGNFFNQELYGPPTDAPWGITIGCDHRVDPYFCPGDSRLAPGSAGYPQDTTGFHPLFFYESALDITGGLVALWLSRRHLARLRDGDLASFWFIWYGSVRFALETFRFSYDWKLLGIMPTAMFIGVAIVTFGIVTIIWRHRQPAPAASEPPQAEDSPDEGEPEPEAAV
jgi:phosphatidylglycerol:prolipoprotein diacylglycerol transferase